MTSPREEREEIVNQRVHLADVEKRLELTLAGDDGPIRTNGDAKRLQQVMSNVLNNAVKFTPEGGSVAIEIAVAPALATVRIQDSGEGIAPEFLPHVFGRFSQADSTLHRRHGGLGLGLAIVKDLVERHGGTVQVESPGVGRGATVTICLPRVP